MYPNDFSDELFESITSTGPLSPASQQLRDALLLQTTRAVRHRRHLRRAAIAVALIGCYLGGMATVSLWPGSRKTDQLVTNSATANDQTHTGAVQQTPVRPEDDQLVVDNMVSTVPPLTPYDRLRRTGDQQLDEYADIPAATRSYEKALQLASSDQRKIAPDRDTWLLMALKHSSNPN